MPDQSLQSDAIREALSALADGQARPDELSKILNAWKNDSETRGAWRDYQFLGDVMRSSDLAQGACSDQFLHKLRRRLDGEPIVVAPAAAQMTAASALDPEVPSRNLRRRAWWGPATVAACFVLMVGAMVAAVLPDVQPPSETFASVGGSKGQPVAAALLPLPAPMSLVSGSDATFSRGAHANTVFMFDSRTEPGHALSGFVGVRDNELHALPVLSAGNELP